MHQGETKDPHDVKIPPAPWGGVVVGSCIGFALTGFEGPITILCAVLIGAILGGFAHTLAEKLPK